MLFSFCLAGQIELYTHIPVFRQLVEHLHQMNFRICGIFLIDAQFMTEASKFVAGVMTALSAMVNLEIPHVNVMSKLDLLSKKVKRDLEKSVLVIIWFFPMIHHLPFIPFWLLAGLNTCMFPFRYLEPNLPDLVAGELQDDPRLNDKFKGLNQAIAGMVST